MDNLNHQTRHKNMVAIKSKNTKPELSVRKILFKLGYRFRLHQLNLPGKPDIVLKKYRLVINVNGCFWHNHKNCKRAVFPKSNQEYWINKIKRNIVRDKHNTSSLKKLGWKEFIIWECQINKPKTLEVLIQNKMANYLKSNSILSSK